jgi:hypothetical protein
MKCRIQLPKPGLRLLTLEKDFLSLGQGLKNLVQQYHESSGETLSGSQ